MSFPVIGAGLLVAGGLINALPPVAERLTKASGGKPIVQVLVGLISIALGIAFVAKIV